MTTTTTGTTAAAQPRGRPTTARPGGGQQSYAIDVRGLSKRYGRRTVVDGLDITVPTGAVAGFVGPNGAGKTTTLRMLLGLVRPAAGSGSVLGEPLGHPVRYLARVGALIESPALYPALSGERNLTALAILGGLDTARVPAVLDEVGLAGRGADAFRTYSLGMKQRLAIGAALLSDPELLVLDEPTNGLDPSGIRQMRELIRTLAGGRDGARPRTVLVSSHLLAEVEQICDWLVVVEGGRLAYQGTADGLMAAGSDGVLLRPEYRDQLGMLADLLAGLGLPALREGDRLRLTLPSTADGDLDAAMGGDAGGGTDGSGVGGVRGSSAGGGSAGGGRADGVGAAGGGTGGGARSGGTGSAGADGVGAAAGARARGRHGADGADDLGGGGRGEDGETTRLIGELNRAALARGITLVEITPIRASLEDRYHGLVEASEASNANDVSDVSDASRTEASRSGGGPR